MSTEIKVNEMFTELGCKELKKELKTIVLADEMGKKSAWTVAESYHKIITEELFEEDFENAKEFSEYIGVSKSTISQYVNAVDFVKNYDTIFSTNKLTVGKAYMLSTLKEDVGMFIEWCEVHDRLIEAMSDKGLKDTIKEWKEELEAVEVEAEEVEAEAEVEEPSEEEFEDVAMIEYGGKVYFIPLDVLAQYEAQKGVGGEKSPLNKDMTYAEINKIRNVVKAMDTDTKKEVVKLIDSDILLEEVLHRLLTAQEQLLMIDRIRKEIV